VKIRKMSKSDQELILVSCVVRVLSSPRRLSHCQSL
jgi:hypothetical protein